MLMKYRRFLPGILLLALIPVQGCAVPIHRQIDPDRLRYSGFDTITSAVMRDGEVIAFDMEPASRTARVVGDTLYCFVEGSYRTLPMSEVESLEVNRYVPLPDTGVMIGSFGESGVSLGKAIWEAFKRSAPVLLPAGLLFFMWQSIR
jgi:hypothetical protein